MAFQIDDRTQDMTQQALMCRSYGHAWTPVPVPRKRQAELATQGMFEDNVECSRCPCRRTTLYDMGNWDVAAHPRTEYPKEGYLSTVKGGGRLPRSAARIAMLVRTRRV